MSFLKAALLEVIKQAKEVSPTSESCPLISALADLEKAADKVDFEAFHRVIPRNDETQLAYEILQVLGK